MEEDHDKVLNYTFNCIDYGQMDMTSDEMGQVYDKIAGYYLLVDQNPRKALEHFKICLNIYEKLYKNDFNKITNIFNSIAACYKDLGQYMRAIDYYQSSLKIYNKFIKKTDHPSIINTYNNIGACYQNLGQFKVALNYYQSAKRIIEVHYLDLYYSDHPTVANSLANVAGVYQDMEEYKTELDYRFRVGKYFLELFSAPLSNFFIILLHKSNDFTKIHGHDLSINMNPFSNCSVVNFFELNVRKFN